MDPYAKWLSDRGQLFTIGDSLWRPYHRALVPACPKPQPIHLDHDLAQEALRKSGTLFIRYSTQTFEHPTEWWYVICDHYCFDQLGKKVRYDIRRGYKYCSVARIDPEWLATSGYECYTAAFRRYRNAAPVSRQEFESNHLDSAGGPFEYWGVFYGNTLAAYAKCVVGDDYAAILVAKSNPDHLNFGSSCVLYETLTRVYAGEQRKVVTNGFRSIAHSTRVQEFLERFGFKRVFCDLRIIYRKPVKFAVNCLYPGKAILEHLHNLTPSTLNTVLKQEEIRRSFARVVEGGS
jgi:hypothetical protein